MDEHAGPSVREVTAIHTTLTTWLDEVGDLGDAFADGPTGDLHARGERLVAFVHDVVLPLLDAEEATVYPEVARLLGAPQATATMVRDHVEIRHLARQIARHVDELVSPVVPAARHELVGLLHGLRAVVKLHLAKEDELYLPLLTRTARTAPAAAALRAMWDATYADGVTADGG